MAILVVLFRVSLFLAWLLCPAVLGILVVRTWRRTRHQIHSRATLSLVIAAAVLTIWILFIIFLASGQTPYGLYYQTSRLTDALLLVSFLALIASIAARAGRWQLLSANVVLVSLWIGVVYAPAHWLKRVDFGEVRIDERPVPASFYIGHPTDMEAEAIVLVQISAAGDYFLDFNNEKVRAAAKHEYLRLPGGVWCVKSVHQMRFVDPLPFRRVNEFRVASPKGEIVSVQF